MHEQAHVVIEPYDPSWPRRFEAEWAALGAVRHRPMSRVCCGIQGLVVLATTFDGTLSVPVLVYVVAGKYHAPPVKPLER